MPANLVERLRAGDAFSKPDDCRHDRCNCAIMDEAAAEIERLEAERDEATVYARNFLVSFVNRYCDPVAEWAPLPDLIGMLTQIDNAATVAGIFRHRAQNAEACCDKLAEALRPFAMGSVDVSNTAVILDEITAKVAKVRAREALEQVGKP